MQNYSTLIGNTIPKDYVDWHLHGMITGWVTVQFLVPGGCTLFVMMTESQMQALPACTE